jgi:CHAT domain-containing protein
MYDSSIKLSELQILRNQSTDLVILSACETNAGKNAVGEGIYSLARGFYAAGVPSVAATLWIADEQSVYTITEKFNEYLSQGCVKTRHCKKQNFFLYNTMKWKNHSPIIGQI